jgi:hypothetical protein
MGCETVIVGGQPVTICRGSAHREVKRKSEGVKWCFVCRERREFFFIMTAPIEPDWYGPHFYVKCETCGVDDADLFPGREREWDL